jgi:MFS family permease
VANATRVNTEVTAGAGVSAPMTGARAAALRLAVVVFLYWAALYFYVPTLPNYVQTKTQSLVLVGTVLSMYGLWQMVIRLPLGIAVDWAGRRKPFILVGLALVGLGAWVMGTADAAQGVLIGRAVTGLAAAAWVPLVVAFSRLFPPAEAVRASALLTVVSSSGRIVATLSNGPLNNVGGYSLAFTVATGVAAVALVIAATTHEAPLPSRRPSVAGVGKLISRRDVLLPSLLSAVAQYANWASTFGFLPILAKNLNASDVMVSTLVSLNIFLGLLGNLTATTLVRRMGARRLCYLSFLLLSAGLGGSAIASDIPMLIASQAAIGLGMGVAYPVLMGMSIRNVVETERTTAMGLHQSVYAAGMFLGPWLSGVMAAGVLGLGVADPGMAVRITFGITAFACLALGTLGTWLLVEQMKH